MKEKAQNYKNHVRIDWVATGFIVPVALAALPISIAHLVQEPGWLSGYLVLAAFAAALSVFKMRGNAIRVQNRVIRLEERLRLEKLLKGPLAKRIPDLTTPQLIAIRFAADAEVPGLVKKALAGMGREDIKKEIRSWRADRLRV